MKTAAAHNAQLTGSVSLGGSGCTTSAAWPTYNHVGTCGKCGGRVMVLSGWIDFVPLSKRCESCGRTAKEFSPPLPVFDMFESPGGE